MPPLRALSGDTDSDSWWANYVRAFGAGVNPMTSILDGMSENTDRMFPPPAAAVAPTPQRWWRPNEPHPVYPAGPPSDFGGAIIPNPDNARVLADTQVPADQLTVGKVSAENFKGKKVPSHLAFPSLRGIVSEQ